MLMFYTTIIKFVAEHRKVVFYGTRFGTLFESPNKITPVCFHNFFLLNSSIHQYEMRQSVCGDFYLVRKNDTICCGMYPIHGGNIME